MKRFIQEYLGITPIQGSLRRLHEDSEHQNEQVAKLLQLKNQITVALEAMGKILVKLDPILAKDEFDADRKAESDRLGQETIDRLIAENKARRHSLGEP